MCVPPAAAARPAEHTIFCRDPQTTSAMYVNIRLKKCENKVPMPVGAGYENICNPMATNLPPPQIEASRYEEMRFQPADIPEPKMQIASGTVKVQNICNPMATNWALRKWFRNRKTTKKTLEIEIGIPDVHASPCTPTTKNMRI